MFIILCILILCILYCILETLTFIILKCLQKNAPHWGALHPTILYILQFVYYTVYIILCILYSVYYTVYYMCHHILIIPPVMVGELCFIDQIIRLIGGNAKI